MNENVNIDNIVRGDINKTLKNLTLPMIFGVLGMVAFNLADTFFVGKLGTNQMAALSFTFPVILFLNSLTLGIGIGTSSVISRAVGQNDREKVTRLSTDSLSLGLIIAIIIAAIGFFTIEPLFTALGAKSDTMPYIMDYMKIWYLGVPMVVIPMIGNNAIRALGDTKTPSVVMLISATLNILLDGAFIFGVGFIPALGIKGAALGTVIARTLTFFIALYVLVIREKVVSFMKIEFHELIRSWKIILAIGIPNAVSRMIIPVGVGLVTNIVANFGTSSVAAFGIASKVEIFAISVINALSSVIPVFVGQNYGANRIDRVKKGVLSSQKFSLMYGLGMYILLVILAKPISYLFTSDPTVSNVVVLYLRIVPLGYAFQGVLLIINGALNALNKPIRASILSLVQTLVIYVPLSYVFSRFFGLKGIFASLAISYLIIAVISHLVVSKEIAKIEEYDARE